MADLLDAARYGDLEDVQAILKENPGLVDYQDEYGSSPLLMAAGNGHCDVIKVLIEHKANINSSNSSQNTPLHWAALNGHLEAVKLLIAAGADVTTKNFRKRTALEEALDRNHTPICDLLAKRESEVREGKKGDTKETGGGDNAEHSGADVDPEIFGAGGAKGEKEEGVEVVEDEDVTEGLS